jgi:hypothetical protein
MDQNVHGVHKNRANEVYHESNGRTTQNEVWLKFK